MGLKPDHWIKKMALEHRMIDPFVEGQMSDGVISFGVSSYGYDIRVADEFKIFQPEITATKLSDMQRGYIAGLIDGQGYVGVMPPTVENFQAARLAFGSSNRPLLENVRSILGTGLIGDQSPGEKSHYELLISRPADIQYILSQIFPYLTEKQSAAALLTKSGYSSVSPKPMWGWLTADSSAPRSRMPSAPPELARSRS